jgi:hypothetical protein
MQNSSSVVEKLQDIVATNKATRMCVGFHCCSLDDAASQQTPNVFGSILAQISVLEPSILESIRPLRKSGTKLIPQNNLTISQIEDLIEEVAGRFDTLYILIDALNETTFEDAIVSTLISLCKTHKNIRVLTTCTRTPPAEIEDNNIHVENMSFNAVSADIDAYVQKRLESESSFRSLTPRLQNTIRNKLSKGADGR